MLTWQPALRPKASDIRELFCTAGRFNRELNALGSNGVRVTGEVLTD